jgi:hypothetical protein
MALELYFSRHSFSQKVIESAGIAVLFNDHNIYPARCRCSVHLQRPLTCNKIILAQMQVKSLIIRFDLRYENTAKHPEPFLTHTFILSALLIFYDGVCFFCI